MIPLDGKHLSIDEAEQIALGNERVEVAKAALRAVESSAQLVEKIVQEGQRAYGINTGFGKLSTVAISREQLWQLQVNLLRSHACGVGEPLPEEVSRAALLFRLHSLLAGHSGVRPVVIEYLLQFLNRRVYPLIPSKGSVGSSGDLAPLAHLALLLIGEGHARLDDHICSGAELLKRLDLQPLKLAPKEGLALINGTQISLAVGFIAWLKAKNLLQHAQLLACLALEAVGGSTDPLDERLHACHPHPGQSQVARDMRLTLAGSQLVNRSPDVQDPYTLRCAPQVLGACLEALQFVQKKIEIEMNSVTDNPLLFPQTGEVLSGGNFHGEILALAFEVLGMSLAQMGNFSERRTAFLLEHPALPPFLIEKSGLHSGLMIPQYTAAALVSENKIFAHPAVVDSIPTSGGKEDYNSLASLCAWKAYQIAKNVEYILAIELLTATQALDFRKTSQMAPATRKAYERVREEIPHLSEDRLLQQDIERARKIIRGEELLHV
jgi:histidine ammonia-lyase